MFFIRGQHAARGCKTQQMYTMKTTPSRSGSAASLIALAALGHPGLAQDYGGLTFPSSYFAYATTKVDTGNGRKYPCVRVVVKDGWQSRFLASESTMLHEYTTWPEHAGDGDGRATY